MHRFAAETLHAMFFNWEGIRKVKKNDMPLDIRAERESQL